MRVRQFFDPHFHIWDVRPNKLTPYKKEVCSPPEKYFVSDYQDDMNVKEHNGLKVEHIGGIYVEAICDDKVFEGRYVFESLEDANERRPKVGCCGGKAEGIDTTDHQYRIVGGCDITQEPSEFRNHLKKLTICTKRWLVGVRDILNFEPSWPGITSNRLDSENLYENLSLLNQQRLAFDLQINPHQMRQAYELLKQLETLEVYNKSPIVVLDHLGCPQGLLQKDMTETQYWKDMCKLATLKNTRVKISMIGYADKNWLSDQETQDVIVENIVRIVQKFGANRCMFASNYPVDKRQEMGSGTMQQIYAVFDRISSQFNELDQEMLWHATAVQAYQVDHKRSNASFDEGSIDMGAQVDMDAASKYGSIDMGINRCDFGSIDMGPVSPGGKVPRALDDDELARL